MDENAKKGPRDINDLKARLGLKKTAGAMPAVTGTPSSTPAIPPPTPSSAAAVPPPVRGVVPPPVAPPPVAAGGQAAAAIPPPPGFRSQEPELPPPPAAPAPDPRRDPFAASGPSYYSPAPAYYAPEPLPGSVDDAPAAAINQPKPWGKFAIAGAVGIVVLSVGYVTGRLMDGRNTYNKTTDDAGIIHKQVEEMSETNRQILKLIQDSAAKTKGAPDPELATAMGTLVFKKKADIDRLFKTNYARMEDLVVNRLFTYYNDTNRLYKLIEDHAKLTDLDKDTLAQAAGADASKGDKRYGVIVDGSRQILTAIFVELGNPTCPKDAENCDPSDWKGFRYRTDSDASWSERPIKGKPTEVIMPIQPSKLFNAVAAGSPSEIAQTHYRERMREIVRLSAQLSQEEKDLLKDLQAVSDRGHLIAL